MLLLRALGNLQHLADLQNFKATFAVLVYSDKCKPCKRLKPLLCEKIHDMELPLYMVSRTQSEDLNTMLGVHQVPRVVVFKEGCERGALQSSDIQKVTEMMEMALGEFTIEEDF